MYKINKKNKILLLNIILSFTLVLISTISYLFVYVTTSQKEVKNRLLTEAEEIVSTHITIDNERIVYKKSNDDITLESDLLSDQLSAVVYNQSSEIIGRFGLTDEHKYPTFSYELSEFSELIKRTLNDKSYDFKGELSLLNQDDSIAISYPILSNNNLYGAILIISPINTWNISLRVTLINLLAILPLSLLLSILISAVISKFSFKELNEIKNKMKQISSTKLNHYINEDNYQEEEVIELISSYNQMLSRLREGFEKQKQFTSNVSHELKTPLTNIINSLEVIKIKKKYTSSEIDQIINQITELSQTINTLFKFAKNSEMKVFDSSEVKMKLVFDELINKFKKEIEMKNLTVINSIEDDFIIETNKEYINIICNNLFSNAIKYNRNNGRISINIQKDNNRNYLSISDTGIGMNIKNSRFLNKRYSKLANDNIPGWGIGLSIVYEICKELNYEVKINSKLGKGTEVLICF